MSRARTWRSSTASPRNQMDRLPGLAADLVRRRVAVIAAFAPAAALAAKGATTTIPIVFSSGDDPVRLGLVANLARPGGNLTGINFLVGELAAKRLELLHELVPGTTRVAVLLSPSAGPITDASLRDVEAASRTKGLQIQVVQADTSREINTVFASFAREQPDSLFIAYQAAPTAKPEIPKKLRRPCSFAAPRYSPLGTSFTLACAPDCP